MHRINHQIRISQIRVIGADGEQLGIMTPDQGRDIAEEAGLDLVEVAPQAAPPVCRIMDYGKFRYEQSKKASASKATQVEVKTITLRPKTDTHDLETKIAHARGFIDKGDHVKLVMRLRGREHAHTMLWIEKLNRVLDAMKDIAQVTQRPREEGRTITAMAAPIGANPNAPGTMPQPS
jgi:translation initiation factor IF-3